MILIIIDSLSDYDLSRFGLKGVRKIKLLPNPVILIRYIYILYG